MNTLDKLIDHLPDTFEKGEPSVVRELLGSVASELTLAQDGVVAALDQMSVSTADADWLDEWGGYFGVPRLVGEPDASYGPRIIVEVIRPRENNVAIAMAITEAFGQRAVVQDAGVWEPDVLGGGNSYSGVIDQFGTLPKIATTFDGQRVHDASHFYGSSLLVFTRHDGSMLHDGTHYYGFDDGNLYSPPGEASVTGAMRQVYGLFDVAYDYNLENGADLAQYATQVRSLVERFRAAGTQMRFMVLNGANLSENIAQVTDGVSVQALGVMPSAPFEDHAHPAPEFVYGSLAHYDGSTSYVAATAPYDDMVLSGLMTHSVDYINPVGLVFYDGSRTHTGALAYSVNPVPMDELSVGVTAPDLADYVHVPPEFVYGGGALYSGSIRYIEQELSVDEFWFDVRCTYDHAGVRLHDGAIKYQSGEIISSVARS